MAAAIRRRDNIIGVREGSLAPRDVLTIIDSLKDKVVADRYSYIKKKVEENKQKLSSITLHVYNLSTCKRNTAVDRTLSDADLLTKRQEDALGMLAGVELSCGETDNSSCQEESSNASTSSVLFGNNILGKNATRLIKLSEVPKLPPYTTWIFLDRCPKICKNRFRGCHCAKSQCRSRQCPCFAADRECDPDVCRNCWVGCGDGSLGGPNQRGDNYECRNMKLLLKQQQRVLLGRSDVSGWGAFLKNSVGKHEYLGEYTGELISHREADKRGKIYDLENSSFLFNLNDQFVLDAYRKGDKLKFANHSPDPNCYAKVIMVAGDHRVGIFAKERICAGEELFYDYRYEPDRAPAWARKPETPGSKKDDSVFPLVGRAKKLA